MCVCFTFYTVLKEKEFSKSPKPSFSLLSLWNFFYNSSCKSSACSIGRIEIKNNCEWKWESQFGAENFMVYLQSRIELTSPCTLWKQMNTAVFFTRLSNPFPQSFQENCELFIPLGFGILADISMVAVWSQANHSVIL